MMILPGDGAATSSGRSRASGRPSAVVNCGGGSRRSAATATAAAIIKSSSYKS